MFPFDLPLASAFYCLLLVLTLVLHVVFMNYVLAGTTIMCIGLSRPADNRLHQLSEILREWLPSALGVAITAGVAPLLFVQICYQEAFFTANLLAFHRWMAIVPVLIIAFYLLYVIKLRIGEKRRPWLNKLIMLGVLHCFIFVAVSWTANTLLAGAGEQAWLDMFANGRWFHNDALLWPRVSLWISGAIPTCCAILLLQCCNHEERTPLLRPIAITALIGMAITTGLGLVNAALADEVTRAAVLGPNLPWLIIIIVAWLLVAVQWIIVTLRGRSAALPAWAMLATMVVVILGATVMREVTRQTGLDMDALLPAHERAFSKGGLVIFLIFAIINTGVIAWIIKTCQATTTVSPQA